MLICRDLWMRGNKRSSGCMTSPSISMIPMAMPRIIWVRSISRRHIRLPTIRPQPTTPRGFKGPPVNGYEWEMCRDQYAFCLGRTATHLLSPPANTFVFFDLIFCLFLVLFSPRVDMDYSKAPTYEEKHCHSYPHLSFSYIFSLHTFFSSSVCLLGMGSTGFPYIFGAFFLNFLCICCLFGLGSKYLGCLIRLFNFSFESAQRLKTIYLFFSFLSLLTHMSGPPWTSFWFSSPLLEQDWYWFWDLDLHISILIYTVTSIALSFINSLFSLYLSKKGLCLQTIWLYYIQHILPLPTGPVVLPLDPDL